MSITIAPVIEFIPVPRTPEFADELHEAEFVLIPQAMSRVADAALRDPILLSTSHLANNIAALKGGLEAGLSDEALQAAYTQYILFKDAVSHWAQAPAGVRYAV